MSAHRGANLPYLYPGLNDFLARHATELASTAEFAALAGSLRACSLSGLQDDPGPHHDELREARFQCLRNSLDDLVSLAARLSDPLEPLASLPCDWHRLHAARHLLEAGRRESAVVAFARRACEVYSARQGKALEADEELGRCLAQLALVEPRPGGLTAQQAALGPSLFGLAAGSHARGLSTLADTNAGDLLAVLDEAVADPANVPVLLNWERQARSWQALLIAKVYARMFPSRPIRRSEASWLAGLMLAAVRSLPGGALREEYEAVYEAIASWLSGTPVVVPALEPGESGSAIRRSHALATALLGDAAATGESHELAGWVREFLSQAACRCESPGYLYRGGSLSRQLGGGQGLTYVMPALRLAGVAVGIRAQVGDPAADLMCQRYRAARALGRVTASLRWDKLTPGSMQRALSRIARLASRFPADERVPMQSGNLLLRLGRLAEAREALQRCLSLASCSEESQGRALYDLSCVAALEGNAEGCRAFLEQAVQRFPELRQQMVNDPDFASIRGCEWFRSLCPAEAAPPAQGS
jgi:hypothetical protein